MHRLVVVASTVCCILAAAACGSSSTAPVDTFSGTWTGGVEEAAVTLTSSQTGNSFSGTGIVVESGDTDAVTFSGTSTPPTLNATLTIGSESGYTFDGTYQSATSVTGFLHLGTDSAQMTLNKQ
jgi:hypothetical protein